jgi:hypothetical protein
MSYQPGQQPTILGRDPYLEFNNQGKILHLNLQKPQHILGQELKLGNFVVTRDSLFVDNFGFAKAERYFLGRIKKGFSTAKPLK